MVLQLGNWWIKFRLFVHSNRAQVDHCLYLTYDSNLASIVVTLNN